MITQEFADKWIAAHRAVGGGRQALVSYGPEIPTSKGHVVCCLLGSAFYADKGRLPGIESDEDEDYAYDGGVFFDHLDLPPTEDDMTPESASLQLARETWRTNDNFRAFINDAPGRRSIVDDGVEYIEGLVS